MGFKKIRTNKGNLWKIKFEVEKSNNTCYTQGTEVLHMSDQPTSDTKTDQQPKIVTNSKTGEKFRVETIKTKTKRKEHPKDHLYQNRPGYEYGKALREKLLDLDPSTDMDALSEEKLVQDHEAVKAFVQTVKTGDIIGVKHSRFKVVGTTEDG